MKDTRLDQATALMDEANERRSEAVQFDIKAKNKREEAHALDTEAQALIDELIEEGA